MQRTKRPPARPILVGLGAVVILGLGVWAVVRASSGTAAGVNPQTVTAKPAETKPPEVKPEKQADKLLATNEPAKPVEPAPMEIRQGKNAAPQAGSLTGQASGAPILGHPAGVDPKLPPAPSSPAPSTLTSNPPPANPAPSPAVTTPPPAAASVTVSPEAQGLVSQASQKLESGDPVAARVMYSKVLADPRLSESDRQAVRNELSTINDDLVFSPRVAKDDPFAMTYAVAGGDSLITIARKLATGPDYRLIARINKMVDQHSLHEGQKLKVLKGPFHVIVNKSAYRMDVYMGPSDKQEDWVYVRSFRVGLGEANGTPIGTFIVKKGSKLIDPPWINPHTGEKFAGGDPKNPIGRRWVGLEGQGDAAKFNGYGIHGTIDPGSIGQQRSMGCVRMATEDIEVVWELLGQQVSVVKIVP